MSLQKTTITVPAKQEERTVSIVCDLCEKDFPQAFDSYDGIMWQGNYGDIQQTCVQLESGYGHLDGGRKTTRSYHVCIECFRTKLEPWLQSQGAKPTIEEIDW